LQPVDRLRLFDVRLGGALDFGWLLQQVECFGVKEQELKQFIDSGLIKTWTDEEDIRGFLRYTPEQVKTLKSLQKLDRYVLRSYSTSCRAGMQTLISLSKFLLTTILIPPRNDG